MSKLSTIRKNLKLSQEDVAQKIGTNQSTLSKIENKPIDNVPFGVIKKLSNIYDISCEELFDDEEDHE